MSKAFFILKIEMQTNGYTVAEIQKGPSREIYESQEVAPLRNIAHIIETLIKKAEIPGGANGMQN